MRGIQRCSLSPTFGRHGSERRHDGNGVLPLFLAFFVAVFADIADSAAARAQQAATVAPRAVAPAELSAYLTGHRGPVIDVRMAGDCDERRRLRRTTHEIEYDFGPQDREGREMAMAEFLGKVRSDRDLMAAHRSGVVVLVICCGGGRSEAAAAQLAKEGFKTAYLLEGVAGEQVPGDILVTQK